MGLNSVYKYEDQLSILWDIKIIAPGAEKLSFKVESCSIPQYKLDVERKFSGETVYKKITHPEAISITFRESSDQSTYAFFRDWMSKFYDFKRHIFYSFTTLEEYNASLYRVNIFYYKPGWPIGIGIPFVENDFSVPTKQFSCLRCKPIGIDDISLDYSDGNALKYTVTLLPEEIFPVDLI